MLLLFIKITGLKYVSSCPVCVIIYVVTKKSAVSGTIVKITSNCSSQYSYTLKQILYRTEVKLMYMFWLLFTFGTYQWTYIIE